MLDVSGPAATFTLPTSQRIFLARLRNELHRLTIALPTRHTTIKKIAVNPAQTLFTQTRVGSEGSQSGIGPCDAMRSIPLDTTKGFQRIPAAQQSGWSSNSERIEMDAAAGASSFAQIPPASTLQGHRVPRLIAGQIAAQSRTNSSRPTVAETRQHSPIKAQVLGHAAAAGSIAASEKASPRGQSYIVLDPVAPQAAISTQPRLGTASVEVGSLRRQHGIVDAGGNHGRVSGAIVRAAQSPAPELVQAAPQKPAVRAEAIGSAPKPSYGGWRLQQGYTPPRSIAPPAQASRRPTVAEPGRSGSLSMAWPQEADVGAQSDRRAGVASGAPPSAGDSGQANTQIQGDVYLDGTLLGRWIARTLAREAGRPPSGGAAFDPRRNPLPAGRTIGT